MTCIPTRNVNCKGQMPELRLLSKLGRDAAEKSAIFEVAASQRPLRLSTGGRVRDRGAALYESLKARSPTRRNAKTKLQRSGWGVASRWRQRMDWHLAALEVRKARGLSRVRFPQRSFLPRTLCHVTCNLLPWHRCHSALSDLIIQPLFLSQEYMPEHDTGLLV
jgi:hypothetical protein